MMKLPASDGEFHLTDEMIQSLRLKYPHTDIDAELAKINLWLHRNPSRRWSRMLVGVEKWLVKVERENRAKGAKLVAITNDWWRSDSATLAYGKQKGVQPRPGESMPDYRRRLRAA